MQKQRRRCGCSVVLIATIILTINSIGEAQQQQVPSTSMSIAQAVESALRNYPSISVSQEQVNAAAAGIDLARTAYLPRVDSLAQVNRATRNNVFGLLFPQGVIPSISGPVLGTNNFGSVWGSAIGGLVTWEPFDFGLRSANVAAATASKTRSEAALRGTQFDVAAAAADAYLTLAAAQETVRAAQAGVDRAKVLVRSVRALVDAQLRPGADASRAEAELAAAQIQVARAQLATEVARAVLARFVGGEPRQINLVAPKLLQFSPGQTASPVNIAMNPIAVEQNVAVEQAKTQLDVLDRSYFPRFFVQGSAYARGSGARIDGSRLGGVNGLAPDVQNYALGFSVTFPIFDLPSIRAKQAGQSATVRAETARHQQITTDLTARWNEAAAILEGSRKIAADTPIQLSAANAATQQATARYQSGLGNVIDVADAQRLLTQAEIDDALARLGVWRAMLCIAIAAGDIQPFLNEAEQ
ncbi:MAG: TolC family protein [Nitrospirae bacterium]|nr:TolC family protein [Nitrospirota bacterium]